MKSQLLVAERVKDYSLSQSEPNQKHWKMEQQAKRHQNLLDELDSMTINYNQHYRLTQQTLQLIRSSKLQELEVVILQLSKLEGKIHEFLNKLSTTVANNIAKKQTKMSHLEYGAKQIMVYALFWFVFLGMIVSFAIAKSMRSSTNYVTEFARKMATGHYSDRIDIKDYDELGQLMNALNDVASSMTAKNE